MKKSFWTFLGWPLLAIPFAIDKLGVALNEFVIAANKGVFPVLVANCNIHPNDFDIHTCMVPGSHLKFLADWLNFHDGIYSPGDILLTIADTIQSPCFWLWMAVILYMAFRYQRELSK